MLLSRGGPLADIVVDCLPICFACAAPRHMRQRLRGCDVTTADTGDDGELRFPVVPDRLGGADDYGVGAVDVWAGPADGLPVEVKITGRGTSQPVLMTRDGDFIGVVAGGGGLGRADAGGDGPGGFGGEGCPRRSQRSGARRGRPDGGCNPDLHAGHHDLAASGCSRRWPAAGFRRGGSVSRWRPCARRRTTAWRCWTPPCRPGRRRTRSGRCRGRRRGSCRCRSR